MAEGPITVGVLGLGSFGVFAATMISKDSNIRVLGHDARQAPKIDGIENVGFTTLANESDALILAVPLRAYDEVLPVVAERIRPETLVVDVCSVKVYPEQNLERHLPSHPNLLASHPLFGPRSAADGLTGHNLIVTTKRGEKADQALLYAQETLGLNVHEMTAEDHDRVQSTNPEQTKEFRLLM